MKKILVIEDDKFLVRLWKSKLEKLGYEIRCVEDGNEIEHILTSWIPDLIVLDFLLPHKDGFQLLKEFKKNDKLIHTPVLALTQLQMESDIALMYHHGVSYYLNKRTINFQDVITKIQSIIPKSSE